MVPPEPQNPGPKLSESLINNPPGVNRPIPFGGRKEPAYTFKARDAWSSQWWPENRCGATISPSRINSGS